MADGGSVTGTDLGALRSAIQQLPADVTAALKAVAQRTAQTIHESAQQILRSSLKTDAHHLIDAIVVTEDAANQQFAVESRPPAGQPTNVPIFVEYGTVKMAARPYMRPAREGARARYVRECESAAVEVVTKALD